jgi:hypothetical protein
MPDESDPLTLHELTTALHSVVAAADRYLDAPARSSATARTTLRYIRTVAASALQTAAGVSS